MPTVDEIADTPSRHAEANLATAEQARESSLELVEDDWKLAAAAERSAETWREDAELQAQQAALWRAEIHRLKARTMANEHAYYPVSKWRGLALTDLERLAEFGRMFRPINSLDWANRGYRAVGADWYIEKLTWCEQELADWLRSAEPLDK